MHALMLNKNYNTSDQMTEWVNININQVLTSMQTKFKINKTNTNKLGLNVLANGLLILNNKIPLPLLNLGMDSFKIKMKLMLLCSKYCWAHSLVFVCIQSRCLRTDLR